MAALSPVCEIIVELGEPRDFGATRDGERRFTPILGGELRGIADAEAGGAVRGLRAAILPGGGDRQLLRRQAGAVGEADPETDPAAVPGGGPAAAPSAGPAAIPSADPAAIPTVEIDARYDALTEQGVLIGMHAVGVRRVARDGGVYFRVTIRFETSEPALAELQNALFVADGVREADRVRHTVYRVD